MSETVQVTVTLPRPPEGYEYTGEFRLPKKGEWTLNLDSGLSSLNAYRWSLVGAYASAEFILRPIVVEVAKKRIRHRQVK